MNNKIGIGEHGECTATGFGECWRYSINMFMNRSKCEYCSSAGRCQNVHAIEEKENRDAAIAKLQDMDTDGELTPQGVIDAIVDGLIPFVRIGD